MYNFSKKQHNRSKYFINKNDENPLIQTNGMEGLQGISQVYRGIVG
jgi:hypothetical protein